MKNKIRDDFKLLVKIIMRLTLHVYYFFPVNKDCLFFMTNMGKSYSCNPKYIFENMINDSRFSNKTFIWCFKDINNCPRELFGYKNVKVIKKRNLVKYFYYLLTSKVLVYNCGGFSYAPIRKEQLLIETWHGGGALKRFGLVVENKTNSSKIGIKLANKDIDVVLSSCASFTQYCIKDSMGFKGLVINSGMPRNDILIKNDSVIRNMIKKKLNIKDGEKVVLYAPTFKGAEHEAKSIDDRYEIIDTDLLKNELSKKFGGEWKFFIRGHQYTKTVEKVKNDGDLTWYPDMQELLLITDVLITDYSSSMWDFALTKKLCLLYVPDIDNFEKNERGFYTPISTWPGIIVKSNNEISNVLKNYNNELYINKIEEYLHNSGSYEKGTASEQVKEYIFNRLEVC